MWAILSRFEEFVIDSAMNLPHLGNCELEWRRQRSFFFHNEKQPRDYDDQLAARDIVPVVELKPFSKKLIVGTD